MVDAYYDEVAIVALLLQLIYHGEKKEKSGN